MLLRKLQAIVRLKMYQQLMATIYNNYIIQKASQSATLLEFGILQYF